MYLSLNTRLWRCLQRKGSSVRILNIELMYLNGHYQTFVRLFLILICADVRLLLSIEEGCQLEHVRYSVEMRGGAVSVTLNIVRTE